MAIWKLLELFSAPISTTVVKLGKHFALYSACYGDGKGSCHASGAEDGQVRNRGGRRVSAEKPLAAYDIYEDAKFQATAPTAHSPPM